MSTAYPTSGPLTADEIREGDPYELSDGRRIHCSPAGARAASATATGAQALVSDPAVSSAGVDAGYSPEPKTLRAPDIAVGNVPEDQLSWIPGVPPLAVEYAGPGQSWPDLAVKIRELLSAGTKHLWVVHLVGPRRVEVHEPGKPVVTMVPGQALTAPGVLQNPVPVEALYDREAAFEVTLRNLLQRRGFQSLEAVQSESREEGREEGRAAALREAILAVMEARQLTPSGEARAAILACRDLETLTRWLRRASVAAEAAGVVDAL